MTFEEKEKCAQIWEMMSGEKTSTNAWCDQAGDALAEALASVHSCSNAMKHVPRPVGSSPGYGWVVGYVFNVLNQRYGMNKDLAFSYCETVRLWQWKSAIQVELGACQR